MSTKKDIKKPVSISLTDKEKNKAKKNAKKQNVTLSQYISFLLRGV